MAITRHWMVSLRSVSICVVDDEGVIIFEDKVVSDVDEIVASLKEFDPDVRSVLYTAAHALVARSDQWSSLKAWMKLKMTAAS